MFDFTIEHIDISKTGNLYFLLNAWLGAYNRRTDVMARAESDQQKIDNLTAQLKKQRTDLQGAINSQSKGE